MHILKQVLIFGKFENNKLKRKIAINKQLKDNIRDHFRVCICNFLSNPDTLFNTGMFHDFKDS